ncbi:MAG: hypothetical protein MJ252_14370, partial [archaeon]|nr:hypothetical protein [archaeon]
MKIFFLFLLLFKYFVCKVDIKEKFKQFLEEFVNNFYFSFEDLSVFNYTRYQITTMKTKYFKMTQNNLTFINDTYASLYNNTVIAKADFFIKLKGLQSFNHLNVFYKFTLNPLNFVLEDFYQKFSFDSVMIDE